MSNRPTAAVDSASGGQYRENLSLPNTPYLAFRTTLSAFWTTWYQLRVEGSSDFSLDRGLYHLILTSLSDPTNWLSMARFFRQTQWSVPGILFVLSSGWLQRIVSYPRFQVLIIEGYREAKSKTATWKWTPGVGSTTIPPLYFLPLITAVVLVEPFDSVISSCLGIM